MAYKHYQLINNSKNILFNIIILIYIEIITKGEPKNLIEAVLQVQGFHPKSYQLYTRAGWAKKLKGNEISYSESYVWPFPILILCPTSNYADAKDIS